MFLVQTLVHKFENISRSGYIKALITLFAALLLVLIYDLRNFQNFSSQEAMDNAQLARNLSEGRGFTTFFIRPFALSLLTRDGSTNVISGEGVPDISNPPVYPCVLAGLMKVTGLEFGIQSAVKKTRPFWGNGSEFRRYKPDFVIVVFNQFLMLCLLALVFLWARRHFDSTVAWASAALLLGTELLWEFASAGLPTILLMLIFMLLVWAITLFDEELRTPRFGKHGAMILVGAIGVILAVGTLTRYSFGWLIVPTLVLVIACSGARAAQFSLVLIVYFAVVLAPWVIRNYHVSGTPFGTAGYSPIETTALFPEHQLERSLDPNVRILPRMLWTKMFSNLHSIREKLIGTGWVFPLFLTGLLISFNNITLRRIRYFALICIVTLALVESLERTQISTDSPLLNGENLLVLMLPLLMVYAVSFFWMLLERLKLAVFETRLIGAAFAAGASLPLIVSLIKGEPSTISYPPYHPVIIQQFASLMQKQEWMMSDVPWAVAWYGNQPCVWLTREAVPDPENSLDRENLIALGEEYKPIKALFLTPLTLNARLVSESVQQRPCSWGQFVLRALVLKDVPDNFPLHETPTGFLPEHLFLADAKRWQGNLEVPDTSVPLDPAVIPEKERAKTPNLFDRGLKPGRR